MVVGGAEKSALQRTSTPLSPDLDQQRLVSARAVAVRRTTFLQLINPPRQRLLDIQISVRTGVLPKLSSVR